MKRTAIFLTIFVVFAIVMGLPLIASQSEADLESKIERLLLPHHGVDIRAIEGLAPRPAIRDVLLRLIAKYRNADPDTVKNLDFILLDRAVFALGQLKEAQALQPLSDLLADRHINDNIRSRAARALGKIDADASKDVLLRSLDPDNHISVRLAAIEALGKARGAAVLDSLQRYLKTEQRDSLRRRATESIREIRSRIQ